MKTHTRSEGISGSESGSGVSMVADESEDVGVGWI